MKDRGDISPTNEKGDCKMKSIMNYIRYLFTSLFGYPSGSVSLNLNHLIESDLIYVVTHRKQTIYHIKVYAKSGSVTMLLLLTMLSGNTKLKGYVKTSTRTINLVDEDVTELTVTIVPPLFGTPSVHLYDEFKYYLSLCCPEGQAIYYYNSEK